MPSEERLFGGNLSGGVVRIGQTVRRPTGPWTDAVHSLLRHLEATGFSGAPRVIGLDDEGREILEFLPGEVAWDERHHCLLGSEHAVEQVGRLLRDFHDAVADFAPDPEATWRFPEHAADAEPFRGEQGLIICHNDCAAWNLVVHPDRWAFIDWDTAGPAPPIWDVAYCAIGVIPTSPTAPHAGWPGAVPVSERLRALADGYQLSSADRDRLPDAIVARLTSTHDHFQRRAQAGVAPWAELWRAGHGRAWEEMRDFAASQVQRWTEVLS